MKTTNTNSKGIKTTTESLPLSVDKVYASQFQKEGTLTAQVRQVINSVSLYPAKKGTRASDDALFSNSDFGFAEKEYPSVENRVHFLNVPLGSTVESVTAKLATLPEPTLIKTLSNRPIVDADQQYAIDNKVGNASLATFANSQVVRYPQGTEKGGIDVSGQLVLDEHSKVQYRALSFSQTHKEDIDLRTADVNDTWMSPEIQAELQGATVMEGQNM